MPSIAPLRRAAGPVLLLGLGLLAGCRETVSCEPGFAFTEDFSECRPICELLDPSQYDLVDGGCPEADGGVEPDGGMMDASPADAGPCPGGCPSERPVCDDGTCVECTVERSDLCVDDTPACGPDNTCVACVSNTECDTPGAARCDTTTNTCTGCDDSAQCADFEGLTACNTVDGACVECFGDDRGACGEDVCDASTNACAVGRTAGGQGLCEDCVSDAECGAGQVCVEQVFESTSVGRFCFFVETAPAPPGPGGDCATVGPYAFGQEVTTVDRRTRRVCGLRFTTCLALSQFRLQGCSEAFTGDSECGVEGLDDGLCRDPSSGAARCTVPCGSTADCPFGSTCSGAAPGFCSL
jgi:hypothetical protein